MSCSGVAVSPGNATGLGTGNVQWYKSCKSTHLRSRKPNCDVFLVGYVPACVFIQKAQATYRRVWPALCVWLWRADNGVKQTPHQDSVFSLFSFLIRRSQCKHITTLVLFDLAVWFWGYNTGTDWVFLSRSRRIKRNKYRNEVSWGPAETENLE